MNSCQHVQTVAAQGYAYIPLMLYKIFLSCYFFYFNTGAKLKQRCNNLYYMVKLFFYCCPLKLKNSMKILSAMPIFTIALPHDRVQLLQELCSNFSSPKTQSIAASNPIAQSQKQSTLSAKPSSKDSNFRRLFHPRLSQTIS